MICVLLWCSLVNVGILQKINVFKCVLWTMLVNFDGISFLQDGESCYFIGYVGICNVGIGRIL